MKYLINFSTPQLQTIHIGKVRDSIRIDQHTRMIVVTDRLSAFDSVLKTPIPYKGAVLNGITNFWFEQTKDIVPSHFIKAIDPNITLVKEALPIRVEMIVRGYMCGSMWRGYQQGQREFSGVTVPDGFAKNQVFPQPILTPTTKEKSDREISPKDLIKEGWVKKKIYDKMADLALQLFACGTQVLAERGIILVDTKYEFGLINNEIVLIDEIHTPDSSRFWRIADYQASPHNVEQVDKEFVRQWLINHQVNGKYPNTLPDDIVQETSRRYLAMYKTITGNDLYINHEEHLNARIARNLVREGIIKEGYVAIVMGSTVDLDHAKKMQKIIEKYDIMTDIRVISAHKNGERLLELAEEYNTSIEPGVVIAVAGRSNGLGGALAANLNLPVINCPPFKDHTDILMNINSSLMMPSLTPAATVVHPDNAAHAALRSLNLSRLRETFSEEITTMKAALQDADVQIRKR